MTNEEIRLQVILKMVESDRSWGGPTALVVAADTIVNFILAGKAN